MWNKGCFSNMRQPSDCDGLLLENIQLIEKVGTKDRKGAASPQSAGSFSGSRGSGVPAVLPKQVLCCRSSMRGHRLCAESGA